MITKGFWHHPVDMLIGPLANVREIAYDLQCSLNLLGTYGEREVQESVRLEVVQELLWSLLLCSHLCDDLLHLRLDADVEHILWSVHLWCLGRLPWASHLYRIEVLLLHRILRIIRQRRLRLRECLWSCSTHMHACSLFSWYFPLSCLASSRRILIDWMTSWRVLPPVLAAALKLIIFDDLDQSIALGIESASAHLTHSVLILFELNDAHSSLISQAYWRLVNSQLVHLRAMFAFLRFDAVDWVVSALWVEVIRLLIIWKDQFLVGILWRMIHFEIKNWSFIVFIDRALC